MAPHATTDNVGCDSGWRDSASMLSSNHFESTGIDQPQGHDVLESIAIVGLSLQFPQDADSAESFWRLLLDGRDTATTFPPDRLNVSALYHPDANRRGTVPVSGGHFLKGSIAAFDAPFFSISGVEAAALDPQQRGLLETTYKALENAGMPLQNIIGSKTSVYTGCFTNDWQQLCFKDPEQSADHTGIGVESCMNANRISWFFDFKGTSVNVDSACSSSLVALDLACQSLRSREVNMSIAAGCNLIFSPDLLHALSNMNMLSPDNRCFSFDHRANGYARGEGFGVLVLKRLEDAINDNDTIRAVIRATGCNQDGYTPGITQPNSESQEGLIRQTYEKAGLSLSHTRFFEAHGTGTAIGDPVETMALGRVFQSFRSLQDPLFVGAVKANIGHLEGASGIAGVIKAIMVLESAVIPPNVNFKRMNPRIDADFFRIKFPLESTPWPCRGLRRASVNSFGFGGTNAHLILDDAFHFLHDRNLAGQHVTVQHPPQFPASHLTAQGIKDLRNENFKLSRPRVLILSANDRNGIKRLTTKYLRYFERLNCNKDDFERFMENMAYTLICRRSKLPWTSFLVVSNVKDLHCLKEMLSPPRQALAQPALCFAFTGQGAQWAGMGKTLSAFAIFNRSLEDAERYLSDIGCPWLLREELFKEAPVSRIDQPEYSQPITTALQVALVDLLHSSGIKATAVIGHSSGEIAAAYCVGAISAKSAWKISFYRGIYATLVAGSKRYNGAMLAVGLSDRQTLPYIHKIATQFGSCDLTVACINSHRNVTVSGDAAQIAALSSMLEKDEVFARKLKVGAAYHSPHMEAVAAEYGRALGLLKPGLSKSQSPVMMSTVTGHKISSSQLCSADYWVSNLVSPVRFYEVMEDLSTRSKREYRKKLDCSHRDRFCIDSILEIGPHSALQGPIQDIIKASARSANISYNSALRRNESGLASFLNAVGHIYCLGYRMDLAFVNGIGTDLHNQPRTLTDLPEYAFDHSQEYWHESKASKANRLTLQARKDLLGKPVSDWSPMEAKWRNFLKISEMPWIEDHIINGSILYPAAGMIVMAIEAISQTVDPKREVEGFSLRDVIFSRALTIPRTSENIETHFYLRPSQEVSDTAPSWCEFRLCAFEHEEWQEFCRGLIRVDYRSNLSEVDEGREVMEELCKYQKFYNLISHSSNNTMARDQVYQTLNACGFGFGPAFQRIQKGSYTKENEATAEIDLYQWPTENHPQVHIIHPTSLDAMLHLSLAALSQGGRQRIPTAVPSVLRNVWIASSGLDHPNERSVRAATWNTSKDFRGSEFDVSVLDPSLTRLLVLVEGARLTTVANPAAVDEPIRSTQDHSSLSLLPDFDMMSQDDISKYCYTLIRSEPEPIEFYRILTFTLYIYLTRALKTLGSLVPQQSHLRRYVNWAELQIDNYENERLPNDSRPWKVLKEDHDYVQSMCDFVEKANDQGRVFVETGQNLPNILRGQLDPLQFLFETHLMKDLYSEINDNRTCFPRLDRYLTTFGHKNPDMRILEVGAGTGGTTAQVLRFLSCDSDGDQCVPLYSTYDYTDISPSFFEQARKDFQNRSGLNFKTLNVESDPIGQGFQAESYDLIIAANVLHATKNINNTLKNIRGLLAPGGKLVMYEVVRPEILRTGFVTGLLPGWWLSAEKYRPWGPCLSTKTWDKVLSDNGFSGVDTEFPDFVHSECHEGSILVATATPPSQQRSPDIQVLIVGEANSSIQMQAGKELSFALQTEYAIACRLCTMTEASTLADCRSFVYIFLQEIERPCLYDMDAELYAVLQRLLSSSSGVLWLSAGGGLSPKNPAYSMIDGLSRTIRNENPGQRFTTLALDILEGLTERQIQSILRLVKLTFLDSGTSHYEPEYTELNGLLNIPRAIKHRQLSQDIHTRSLPYNVSTKTVQESPALKLAMGSVGLVDSLHFVEDDGHMRPLEEGEIEIRVQAIGLNFLDCLIALGRVPGISIGQECAGVVTRVGGKCDIAVGDRAVMFASNSFQTFARGRAHNVCKMPSEMSFLEAASIPVQFSTAWQVVCELARIRKGETILVHAGTGGTGQAVIQLSQYIGAEVFATVGSNAKKRILIHEYGIAEDHIFYSRNTSFAKGVMRMTNGLGVDAIINCLAGDSLIASWECIASFGRFVEIGKKDVLSNSKLPMYPFRKNASFIYFDGFSWAQEKPLAAKKGLQAIFALFGEKKLSAQRPLHRHSISGVVEVLQMIQSGKTAGKHVLEVSPKDRLPTVLRTKPSFYLRPDSTYLIAGGLGGLGRSIARWMASRGARNLLLLSRSGANSESAITFLDEMRSSGIRVEAPPCNIRDANFLKHVLERCTGGIELPPVRGCLQSTMVLRDALFEEMSYDDWKVATDCKSMGSWNLHELLPKDLDFFVMLASASGIIGLQGQANYAAGNTYMDALARHRVAQGQKAVSLDLGVMTDDGFLAENEEFLNRVLAYGAFTPITRDYFHALLDYYCNPELPILTPQESQALVGLGNGVSTRLSDATAPSQALFRHLRRTQHILASTAADDTDVVDFKILFAQSTSLVDAGAVVSQALVKKLSKTMSTMHDEVDLERPLHAHGVDSLLAVELRSWMAKEFSADVPVFEILGGSTLTSVGISVAMKSKLRHEPWAL